MQSAEFHSQPHGIDYIGNLVGAFQQGLVLTSSYTGAFGAETVFNQLKHGVQEYVSLDIASVQVVNYSCSDISPILETLISL